VEFFGVQVPFYIGGLVILLFYFSVYGRAIISYQLPASANLIFPDGSGRYDGEPEHIANLHAPQVVVAMAAYSHPGIFYHQPFIWSLRCAGYKGDIVLVVVPELHYSPPAELATFFQDMGVTTQAGAGMEGVVCPTEDKLNQTSYLDPRCMKPEFSRYYEYQRALTNYKDPHTRVLLIDFRDTVFQVSVLSKLIRYIIAMCMYIHV
jgi:hypothetical protein